MKFLKDLIDIDSDIMIDGITEDSRLVSENYLFVATKGFNVDHYDYINDAINNGCSFLVVDREIDIDFPHIVVDNINSYYKNLCIKFYDLNLERFNFIGVTGTDGKTTTTTIVKELIGDCAYIGTNGLIIGDETITTNNTTPCISELYSYLKKISDKNIKNVVMEVSSEALLHDRVSNFNYSVVGYTNITGDHLNIHGSFENYLNAKLKLLSLVKENGNIVINGDDEYLKKIQVNNLCSFGFNTYNDFVISDVKYSNKNTSFLLKNKNKIYQINTPFVGKYNVYNVVEAFIICLLYGIDSYLLCNRIMKLSPIRGRGEFLDFGQTYDIVLDYAHTINGVREVLNAFSNYENIIVVTGCAGGRDKSKRTIIGDMVMNNSTIAIFTADDPRDESVDEIINQMVLNNNKYIREINRDKAIFKALNLASEKGENTVVLILGKGRDNYMAVNDSKVPYSDYLVIKSYFK